MILGIRTSLVNDSWPDDLSQVHVNRLFIGPLCPAPIFPRDAFVDHNIEDAALGAYGLLKPLSLSAAFLGRAPWQYPL